MLNHIGQTGSWLNMHREDCEGGIMLTAVSCYRLEKVYNGSVVLPLGIRGDNFEKLPAHTNP